MSSLSGSQVREPTPLDEIEYLYPLLVGVGVFVQVTGGLGLLVRRKKFPINGRSISLVLVNLAGAITAGVFHLSQAASSPSPSCLATVWFLVNSLFVLNSIFVRAFRVWYLLFTSHQQLAIYRQFLQRTPFALSPFGNGAGANVPPPPPPPKTADSSGVEIGVARGLDDFNDPSVLTRPVEARPLTLWFVRRPQLGKSKFLRPFLVWLTIVDTTVMLLLWFLGDKDDGEDDECSLAEGSIALEYLYARAFLFLLALMLFGVAIRKRHDGFSIKREFTYSALLALPASAVLVATRFFGADFDFEANVALWALFVVGSMTNTYYPLAKSFGLALPELPSCLSWPRDCLPCTHRQRKGFKTFPGVTSRTALRDILTAEEHKDARKDFEEHLANEFSLENIVFYDRALKLREDCDALTDDALTLRTLEVYHDFIMEDAPSQLNIPARFRRGILAEIRAKVGNYDKLLADMYKRESAGRRSFSRATSMRLMMPVMRAQSSITSTGGSPRTTDLDIELFDRISHGIFDDTCDEVYKMMKNDSFSRWKASQRKSSRSRRSRFSRSSRTSGGTEVELR